MLCLLFYVVFFCYRCGSHRVLHVLTRACPTRRSADLVGVAFAGTRGVAVEVNSETDFVAKNDQFQDFVRKTTQVALGLGADDVEALKAAAYPDGGTVAEKLTGNVATIGENQQIRSVEHTSELQSLMRISYAVFCYRKKHTK